jgi:hypothetical protein
METFNEIPTINEISEAAGRPLPFIKGCYIFGSRVYGTADRRSDWDIILIANAPQDELELSINSLNIHIVSPYKFLMWVNMNNIKAIECLFAPKWARLIDFDCDFKYIEPRFRHDISHTVSNSWVKCKKKLKKSEYRTGIKSLFHSLRIADFGIQFVESGEIDFTSSNWIWEKLSTREWNWLDLDQEWRELKNERMTQFRSICKK